MFASRATTHRGFGLFATGSHGRSHLGLLLLADAQGFCAACVIEVQPVGKHVIHAPCMLGKPGGEFTREHSTHFDLAVDHHLAHFATEVENVGMFVCMAVRRREAGSLHALVLVGKMGVAVFNESVERAHEGRIIGLAQGVQAVDKLPVRVVHSGFAKDEIVRPFEQCHGRGVSSLERIAHYNGGRCCHAARRGGS